MQIKNKTLVILSCILLFFILHTTDLSPIWFWPWYAERVHYLYTNYPILPFNLLIILTLGAYLKAVAESKLTIKNN